MPAWQARRRREPRRITRLLHRRPASRAIINAFFSPSAGTMMVAARRWMVLWVFAGLQLHIGPAVADRGGVGGGAAPATVLGSGQKQRLQQILAPYRADGLTAQDARQLRQALRAAGFQPGPALDAELRHHGLSIKVIERLAGPDTAASAAAPAPSASTSTRKLPRPQ